jgi:hypothetical protein
MPNFRLSDQHAPESAASEDAIEAATPRTWSARIRSAWRRSPATPWWIGAGLFVVLSSTIGGTQSGCAMLTAPTPEPTPTAVPTPRPGVFDPTDGTTATPPAEDLNAPNDPKKPDSYQVMRVEAGNLLWMRSVKMVPGTKPGEKIPQYGTVNPYHLAGILVPAPNAPGGPESIRTAESWTMGLDSKGQPVYVDVKQDVRWPVDPQNRPMVAVFFKGRAGDTKDVSLMLNRMMVRSGYAVVDLHAYTSFDIHTWMHDEEYARTTINPLTKLPGIGLWAMNIVYAGRLPSPTPTPNPLATGAPGAPPVVNAPPGAPPGKTLPGKAAPPGPPAKMPALKTTTRTTTTTTVSGPRAPRVPGAKAP